MKKLIFISGAILIAATISAFLYSCSTSELEVKKEVKPQFRVEGYLTIGEVQNILSQTNKTSTTKPAWYSVEYSDTENIYYYVDPSGTDYTIVYQWEEVDDIDPLASDCDQEYDDLGGGEDRCYDTSDDCKNVIEENENGSYTLKIVKCVDTPSV